MTTRSLYYSLRSQYRLARRDLLANPNGVALCVSINDTLRKLTNSWDVGTTKPENWTMYRRRSHNRWEIFVSRSLSQWLKANP